MRIPNAAHESGPWRIGGVVSDFVLEDVWALPVHGHTDDFQRLVDLMVRSDPAGIMSFPARVLWGARDLLGRWFGLGEISADDVYRPTLPIPGTGDTSLVSRLPEDLCGTATDLVFGSLPFAPLYRTEDEFAAELSNQTVHAVMHLAWVDDGQGRFQGQMAVYVKPRGHLGHTYMALIKPFRHLIVYPAFMRQLERAWNARAPQGGHPPASTSSPTPTGN